MHDYIENLHPDQPDPSLRGLVAWLEAEVVMRGPRTTYSFYNLRGDCLYAQYGLSLWPDLDRWEAYTRVCDGLRREIHKSTRWIEPLDVAVGFPHKLGAALTRARVAVAEQEAIRRAEIDEFLHQVHTCKTVARQCKEDVVLRDDVLVFVQQVRALPRRTGI